MMYMYVGHFMSHKYTRDNAGSPTPSDSSESSEASSKQQAPECRMGEKVI